MIKQLIRFSLFTLFGLFGCSQKPSGTISPSANYKSICAESGMPYEECVQKFEFAQSAREIKTFAELLDGKEKSVEKRFDCKIVELDGTVSSCSFEDAITCFASLKSLNKPARHPIFEIKKSGKVILVAQGLGLWDKIWAKILVDSQTLDIDLVEFSSNDETPGLGARITEEGFEQQFEGVKIQLNNSPYFLSDLGKDYSQRSREDSRRKPYEIDGLSGATLTCQGVVKMLNEDLGVYKPYFEK